jgi:hypothetical protein
VRMGRISNNSTATPRRAHCHAASDPASPAPMMRTFFIQTTSCRFNALRLQCNFAESVYYRAQDTGEIECPESV